MARTIIEFILLESLIDTDTYTFFSILEKIIASLQISLPVIQRVNNQRVALTDKLRVVDIGKNTPKILSK
jgi:hypothetical protein